MKFNTEIELGNKRIAIEDEATDSKEMLRKLAFWHSLPTAGPNGEKDLCFSYRTPQSYEFFSILCPSAKKEFTFGQAKKDGALFPKGWHDIQHDISKYEQPEELTPSAPQSSTQPADELAQKRAANAAATAAQAPYRAVAPAPACPSGVSPDVWDAHCAAVAVIDNLTSDWRSQRQLGQWLGEMIQAEEYESTDLYACHPEDIAEVEAVIRGLNLKPTGKISKEMQRIRFRAICAKLGYFDRADSVEKQFTANGVVDWKSAAGKILSLAQVQK